MKGLRRMTKLIKSPVVASVLTIALASVCGVASGAPQDQRAPRNSKEHEEVARLREEHGIRAAASAFGRYVGEESDGGELVAADMTTLAWWSDLVFVGRVLSGESHLSQDGRHITTEYKLELEQVFKSPWPLTGRVVVDVSLPGGEMTFENGASAVTSARSFRDRMEVGKRYLLFVENTETAVPEGLRASLGPLGRFNIALGAQGLFEVRTQDALTKLVPCGHPDAPSAKEVSTLTSGAAIIQHISRAVTNAHAKPARKSARPQTPPAG